MSFHKKLALIFVFYMTTTVLYFLFDIYACYECSTERLIYVCFLIGHVLVLFLLAKIIKSSSLVVVLVAAPLVLWVSMAVLANLMWSIAPFLKYQ